jgi:RAB protein geranylgeranyltransferase component A
VLAALARTELRAHLYRALSKAGFKVAHLDVDKYYGAEEASLSLEEFVQWTASSSLRYTHITRDGNTSLSHSRSYSLSLCPSVIPSVGPIISSLISSGVSKYGGFKLVDSVGIYSSGTVKSVPSSKEDIFKNKQLTLVDKRRIMRFLTFAMSEFEDKPEMKQADLSFFEFVKTVFGLGEDVVEAIGYALAYCTSPIGFSLSLSVWIRTDAAI